MKARFLLSAMLVFSCHLTYSQDPGMQAAQMATQTALQISQQQQIQEQQFELTNIINLQLQNTANLFDFPESTAPVVGSALQPNFSVKSGKVDPGTIVRIQSPTHYATIYYTTDGWSPTAASKRYTGPITIDRETHIQALAVGPNLLHSAIARADYWTQAPSKAPPATPATVSALVIDGVLPSGTPLRLTTTTEISSKSAQVGDKVPLALDQDIKVGNTIVAAKGTPVDAILTVADQPAKRGIPADLLFKVQDLTVQGKTIHLNGAQTLEGEPGTNHGNAIIEPGMPVLATVIKDTPLKP